MSEAGKGGGCIICAGFMVVISMSTSADTFGESCMASSMSLREWSMSCTDASRVLGLRKRG